MPKHAELREQLLARRRELLARVQSIETSFRREDEPLEKDAEEQSLQIENDDVLKALDQAGRRELASVERALAWDHLTDPDRVAAAALTPLEALGHLPALDVDDAAMARILHGGSVSVAGEEGTGTVVLAHAGSLVAIGERDHGVVHPRKVFAEP